MTKFDAIPDELKERDQWLLWDSSADTPRRPHWAGNFGISWSDPDDWHSFEEAVETAAQRDSWGIGYVMALDNDDHARGLYGCLDLDGCIAEDGGPKDWLPSLEPFLKDRAYAEYSASGEGIHIPLVGQQPPEWWSDSHFSADEHEGVEYLTNKFVAFTGDAMQGCEGAAVADTNPAPFLFDAYKELNGESPRFDDAADHSGRQTDDELTSEQVENALDALDAGCAYPKWRNLAFAVHDWDSGPTGKGIFESWSRMSSAWDDQSQRLIDNIWDNSKQGDGVTVGTLIHHATNAGWSPSQTTHPPPSSKDATTDEAATDGGGAAAQSASTADTGPEEPDGSESDPYADWAELRNMFRGADNGDERATPRFEAAMKLHTELNFANLQENEVLYAYDAERGIFDDNGKQVVRQYLTNGLEEQYRGHTMSEVLDQIRGRNTLSQREMGGPDGLIAARNCVIDLHEHTRRDHSAEYRFLSRLGCDFDPGATAPEWHSFLDDVVPGESERKKLQEFVGYALHHWSLPFHKALFLVGPTASGKSTFLDTVNELLGEGTVASLTPQQLTGERFGPAELFGKWANIRNDIPKSTVKNTGMFKELIAGDPMKAEKKNKDPFFFNPTAKHLFSANQLPEMDVDDEAFFRRILLVPFPETVPEEERDKFLDEKLQAELPGILNWAIEGLQRLLGNGGFTGDRSPARTRETWSKWGDSVSRFAKHAIDDGDDNIPKSDMYAAFLEFCRQESIPSDTQHKMTRELKQEGFNDDRAYVDGAQKRVFTNVSWTGRGQELLDAAQSPRQSEGDSSSDGDRRPTGLKDFD